eukprot:GFUD01080532.1.p1 GENE.GFUD01080532.1~~GFUD01080532.1.p1  ORF type:complete len:104 (+),score=38.62 GFUD01080532.1:50-361(+)
MEDNKEISKEMEVKQRAEVLKDRRRSVNKYVEVLWNKDDTNGAAGLDVENGKTNKEVELTQAADKLELKRKMVGKWLAKCKVEETEQGQVVQDENAQPVHPIM